MCHCVECWTSEERLEGGFPASNQDSFPNKQAAYNPNAVWLKILVEVSPCEGCYCLWFNSLSVLILMLVLDKSHGNYKHAYLSRLRFSEMILLWSWQRHSFYCSWWRWFVYKESRCASCVVSLGMWSTTSALNMAIACSNTAAGPRKRANVAWSQIPTWRLKRRRCCWRVDRECKRTWLLSSLTWLQVLDCCLDPVDSCFAAADAVLAVT